MITAIMIGAALGFILAMPPGPIAMANIKLGLEKSRKECAQFAIGTAAMDMLYCVIAIFAASAINTAVNDYIIAYPLLSVIFQFVIVFGLVYYGILQFKKRNNLIKDLKVSAETTSNSFIQNLKHKGPLFLGIALALTNLANPTFVPSLAVMSGWVHKTGLFSNQYLENILFSVGFGIGNFLWLYVLGAIIIHNRHKFSDNTVFRIKQFAGVTFISFGGLIGYRALMFTNWAQIFKFAIVF